MAQIEIKNLKFSYKDDEKVVLDDISLKIKKGDFVVISGKSGCGKTTLLRHMKTELMPFGTRKGEVLVSENLKIAGKIGFVMQNPEAQIVTDKVWHELAFGLENLGYKTEIIRLRVAEMAEYFGITDWYYKSVDTLSGGQKQLLNLAAVMSLHPEVVILDEPTAQLDPIAAENFLDMIKKIHDELGITIIMSEHRLENVLLYADKLLVMKQGKIEYNDRPEAVLKKMWNEEVLKLMPVSVRLFKKVVGREDDNIPLSIADGRRWLETLGIKGTISETKERPKESIAFCKNIWFRYEKSGEDVIKGLNLKVGKGEIFCILGGNGTGKTTMMSLLSGINKPYRGKIRLEGKVSALPQDVRTLFKKATVFEELEGVSEEIIQTMELEQLLGKHPYDLSGGQQQKLALAKVINQNPDILLLDEPTKGLDGIYKETLGEMLKIWKHEGKTIIIVSHDVDFCGKYADRCGLFAQGILIAESDFREFFSTNRFYTTSVNKIAGQNIIGAVREEDVVCFLNREDTISYPS